MGYMAWKFYAIVIVFCLPLFSENKIPIFVNVGGSGQLGYKLPYVSVGGAVENYQKRCWFHVTGKFSTTDKVSYGDVTQYGVDAEAFWNNRRGLFIGGGGRLRNITFHDLGQSHWTYGPTIGGGWLNYGLKILVRGHVYERDTRYDFSGVSMSMAYDFKGKLRLGYEYDFYRFKPKRSDWKPQGAVVTSILIGWVF